MTYYKINNHYTWFEGKLMYINNSFKETKVYEINIFNIDLNHNKELISYKECIVPNSNDTVIDISSIKKMQEIILSKKREIKLNKLLYDI